VRVRWRDDDGQLLLLICVYAVVAAVLVMVVVDVSKLFLYRRSLSAAADGAALAAAQSLDRTAFYRQGPGDVLPLGADSADAAVRRYIEQNRLADRYDDFTVDPARLSDDGRTVTILVHCRMRLPFVGFFTGGDQSIAVDAGASAESLVG